uniref:ML-like domain-containing protein n=1 Tax=Fusarium oxysporum (strain Fo5176) TaxID=660025 RepID=A0A0D2X8L6_FUSOF
MTPLANFNSLGYFSFLDSLNLEAMQLGLTSQQLVDCSQDCRPYSHHRGLIQDLPRRRHVARSSRSPISGSAPAAFAPVDSSGHSRNQCYSTTMTQAVPRQRAWLPRYSTISRLSKSLLVALLIAMHAISPAHAVRIPFTNCLSDAYRLHEPTRLQWVPLYADAVFDTENEKHNLRVIVWGNVTGARTTSALPPPDDPSWKDASDINGQNRRNSPEEGWLQHCYDLLPQGSLLDICSVQQRQI